jgi:hypothetical protein
MSREKPILFSFSFSGDVVLTPEQIWPDGDGPAHPTADDVRALLDKLYGDNPYPVPQIIHEWGLTDALQLDIDYQPWPTYEGTPE